MPPGYRPDGGAMPLEGGVPWESPHGGLFGRWWETMTAANFKGRELFAAVGQSDDAMSACLFSMATGAVAGAVIGLFYMVIIGIWGTAMLAIFGSLGLGKLGGAAAGVGIGIVFLFVVGLMIAYAVFGFIGPWVVGGFHHLVLMMVSGVGPGKEYSHTVRVNAYASAAALLFMPVPLMGGLIVLVFNIINHVTGYDQVHRCGGGKAFLAWVSPVFLCCCCYFMLFVMIAALG
jgi:hypothetical protein